MDIEISQDERLERRSRHQQDRAFVAAMLRAVRMGLEHATCQSPQQDVSGACPEPAASTTADDAQTPQSATDKTAPAFR